MITDKNKDNNEDESKGADNHDHHEKVKITILRLIIKLTISVKTMIISGMVMTMKIVLWSNPINCFGDCYIVIHITGIICHKTCFNIKTYNKHDAVLRFDIIILVT